MLGGLVAAGAAVAGVEIERGSGHRAGVRLFGAAGSFVGFAGRSHLPSGESVATVPVPGWRFGAGQAAFGCAVVQDGSVIVGTTPFSDNPLQPTGADMELGVLRPDAPAFRGITVPSTRGNTILPGNTGGGVGGGDVSAVVPLPGGSPARVMFISTAPYHGWDVSSYGELPSIGQLVRTDTGWKYDDDRSRTAQDLAAESPATIADAAFPLRDGGPRDNQGTTDAIVLPRSGHVIVAQYFGSGSNESGGLLALDPRSGRVLGFWKHPSIQVFGQQVICHPRQLAADPSSKRGDERFTVVYDTFDPAGGTVPFPIQEFSYRSDTGVIQPVSTAVRAAQDGTRMELAQFLTDGTLVVARTTQDGSSAATMAVYDKSSGERSLARYPPVPSGTDGGDSAWGATCPPDMLVAGTDRGGLVRSLSVDQKTGRVLLGGLNGLVQSVHRKGSGKHRHWQTGKVVNLGLDLLRTPQRYPIGLRQGAIDDKRRLLWLPCNQLTLGVVPYPVPPFPLDQWIYAVSLDDL